MFGVVVIIFVCYTLLSCPFCVLMVLSLWKVVVGVCARLFRLPCCVFLPVATMVFKSDYPKFDQEAPPEDFDPAKPYADPVAMLEQREYRVREKLIQVETAKILRQRVQHCYWREGVNHYQKCKPMVDKYMKSLQNIGWGKEGRPAYLNHLDAEAEAKA